MNGMISPSALVLLALLSAPPGAGECSLPGLAEPAGLPGVPFEELQERADAAWDADRVAEALRFYRAGVDLNPLWLDGRWRLALLFSLAGCDVEARDTVEVLADRAPESAQAWSLLGLSEYRAGEYEPALVHLSRAAGLGFPRGSVGFEAKRALVLLLGRSGEFAGAARFLDELVQERPDDAETVVACGLVALRRRLLPSEIAPGDDAVVEATGRAVRAALSGEQEEARERFDDLVARYPTTRGVHFAYGLVLSEEDASPRAREMLRREVELFPDNAEAWTLLAFETLEQGPPAEALEPARAAVELTPDSFWSRLALGRALLAAGQVDEAVATLEQLAREHPEREDTYVPLALAYERAGRPDDVQRVRDTLRDIYLKRGAGP
jgi:tetratricopeptide (TPR) repeat protein